MRTLLVLADDLTGALDTTVQFVGYASPLRVAVRPGADVQAEVLGVNTGTRAVAAPHVRSRLQDAWGSHRASRLYLKVDSALRGPVAASIQVLLECGAAGFAVLAPAFPARSRITVAGRQHAPGFSERTDHIDVPALLCDQGLAPVHVPLAELRAGAAALRARLEGVRTTTVVVDAETDEDLRILARAIADWPEAMPVGSAGFAGAVAREWFQDRVVSHRQWEPIKGPILFVAGSQHPATQSQVHHLAAAGRATVFELEPRLVRARRGAEAVTRQLAEKVGEAIRARRDVALTPTDQGEPRGDRLEDTTIADGLTDVARRLLSRGEFEAVVVTGGYTAAQLCDRLRIDCLDVVEELSPGIVLARLTAARHGLRWLVTKAGSFGGARALDQIGNSLREGKRCEETDHLSSP